MPILIPVAAFLIFVQILRQAGYEWRAARNVSGKPKSKNKITSMDFANRLDFASKGLLLGAGVIVALVGLTAVMAAPSMWDAMLYHLPQVTMWMSNRNVRFFPTPDYLQSVMAPWSEYTMMHTIMLWGSDRFVNLVQFFSYLGSIIGVSLIARQLGAGPRGQVLAAVVRATIPEGILEASGPMNTYVVSFWVTATVVFLLLWNEDTNWLNTICIGLAAGLAILTKGTAYIYLPFLVAACWLLGTRETRLLFLKRSPALVALILALNVAQYYRNYELGKPAHLVLFLVSLFLVLVKHPPNLSRKPIWYGLGVAASFVLLSAALRWSPYVSRYHLAWFVLGSPLIGLVLERYFPPKMATGIAVAVPAYGLVFANTNNVRALLPLRRNIAVFSQEAANPK